MKSEEELLGKYKDRNLKEELSWAAYYTRKGYMSAEYEDYYRWLAIAAYNWIKELEAEDNEWETPIMLSDHLKQAADAIEEPQKQRDEWESHAALAESFARGWIPVTERLPKENGRYLVRYVRDIDLADGVHSDEVRIMRFADAQWRFPFICTSYVRKLVTMEKVTHWMPLPEPLKEE